MLIPVLVWFILILIVILVDRPGDVLVSGSKCPVCLELIQLYGSSDMVAPWFCNCIIESKSETELKNSRQTIFGVYRGRGFGTRPYLRKRREKE